MSSYSKMGSIHDLLQCPYNPSHMVGASKFQTHLVNCRKNNPDIAKNMTICPYNQTHHVLQEDLSLHLLVCREYLDQQIQGLSSTGYLPDNIWDDEKEEEVPSTSNAGAFRGASSAASDISECPQSPHTESEYSDVDSECGKPGFFKSETVHKTSGSSGVRK